MVRFKTTFILCVFSLFLLLPVVCLEAAAPTVPTLIRIFDNAIFNAYPPSYACTLSVQSTDPEGDSIEYEIYWEHDPLFGSPNDTLAGLFASGSEATIVIPLGSAAEAESLHYWKARARDPNESNTWSSWSETRSFTIDMDLPQSSVYWCMVAGPQFGKCLTSHIRVQGGSLTLDTALIDLQEFEGGGLPSLGWDIIDLDQSPNKGWKRTNALAHSGTRSARCEGDDEEVYSILVSKLYDLENFFACSLSCFLRDDNASLYQYHGLWASTHSQTDTSDFSEVDTIFATAEDTWEENKIDLSAYDGEDTVYLGYCYKETDGADWYVDDHKLFAVHRAGTLSTQAIAYEGLKNEDPTRSSWIGAKWTKSHEDDSIGLQIEYLSGGSWDLVPDADLPGNSNGFYDVDTFFCNVDLSGLNPGTYDTLRMRMTFKQYGTTNPSLNMLALGMTGGITFVEPIDEQEDFVIFSELNPFIRNTMIKYRLPEMSDVKIAVYDLMGREINVLTEGRKEKGENSITWNGTDKRGSRIPVGVYIVRMEAGRVRKSLKLLRLR
jgi:hypothetical protein